MQEDIIQDITSLNQLDMILGASISPNFDRKNDDQRHLGVCACRIVRPNHMGYFT